MLPHPFLFAALGAVAALAPHQPPHAPRQPAERPTADARYRCASGVALRARYYTDRVRVTLPGGDVTLPQALAADGARYADDTLVF